MHKLILPILFAAIAPLSLASGAELTQDDALRNVLLNIARRGYEAANTKWELQLGVTGDVLVWSRRLLEAESGQFKALTSDDRAAKAHLKRLEELRRKVNVSDSLEAARLPNRSGNGRPRR